jgi:hypothetical protein
MTWDPKTWDPKVTAGDVVAAFADPARSAIGSGALAKLMGALMDCVEGSADGVPAGVRLVFVEDVPLLAPARRALAATKVGEADEAGWLTMSVEVEVDERGAGQVPLEGGAPLWVQVAPGPFVLDSLMLVRHAAPGTTVTVTYLTRGE